MIRPHDKSTLSDLRSIVETSETTKESLIEFAKYFSDILYDLDCGGSSTFLDKYLSEIEEE